MKNNFSRSNVNESTLEITDPLRSSFDLSHRNNMTVKMGQLTVANLERLIASDVVQGSLNPKFQLEVAMTPTIGKLRLDTHTFQVNMRRIHSGFRQFVESNNNNQVLPSFSVSTIAAKYLRMLVTSIPNNVNATWSGIAADKISSLFTYASGDTGVQIATKIKTKVLAGILKWLQLSGTELGFNKDFLAIEYNRISAVNVGTDNNTAISNILYEILKPLFGEGSTLDFVGYPIYHKLGIWYNATTDGQGQNNPTLAGLFATQPDTPISEVFRIITMATSGGSVVYTTQDDELYSEMPLRAIYAIYYDYFRDWHVEPRDKVLDPDEFNQFDLLNNNTAPMYVIMQYVLSLLGPRYRYYSRDFLTTVQTDDIYRHVYAPVFGNPTDISSSTATLNSREESSSKLPLVSGSYDNTVGSLINIMEGVSSNVPFLSDLFYSQNPNDPYPASNPRFGFFSDLQTMRRAGMLEKWLARNYFFPDTYVGQLKAHYGVEPSDVNILISQYLGGTEQMVSGDQQIAPVDTPQMSAGSRTIVSGVNATDGFSYRASDHCYIISFVSLMPLVNYDIKNMHLKELRKMDIATPEFAQDSRVAIRTRDMLRGFDYQNEVLGYVPRYYHYRVHGDETHGRYLTDYRSFAWFRDWYNMTFSTNIADILHLSPLDSRGFALNPYALRVHLVPEAFKGLTMWDDIAYGSCDIEFYANRPLPAAVDIV